MQRRGGRRSWRAAAAAALALPSSAAMVGPAAGGVVVQQIEAFEVDAGDDSNHPTRYASVEFGGAATQTPATGGYAGITLHADATLPLTPTFSFHANVVGNLFYGSGVSPAYGLVSDVYATEADAFLSNVVNVQPALGTAAAPGAFATGAAVVNNSWVGDFGTTAQDVDCQRRVDFMAARADVTFTAAAVTGATTTNGVADADPIVWSSYNALAVSGAQTFDPTKSTGKPHADLSEPGVEASFATAQVSGFAAALVGRATAAGQADATGGHVVRSLLMAGADKAAYTPTTANHLDAHNGAGQPDYDASLAILQGGEKGLATVTSGSAAGTPGVTQQGWATGTVAIGGQSVVLFTAPNTVTGLTASLNWNVTQNQPSAGMIDTTDAGVIFPDLTLEVRPVTLSGGRYVLGAAVSDASLHSAATADNVQYLYSGSTLAAGTYAFLIGGDPALSATVGLSYGLGGTFASTYLPGVSGTWGLAGNWISHGIPNGPAAAATIAANAGVTVSLDGDRRVGRLTFGGASGSTVSPGTGGTLTIDDSGDSSGTAAPAITTSGSGTYAVTAPVALVNGVGVSVGTGGTLTLAGAVTGTGGLTKSGSGSLVLTGADAFGNATVTAGTLTLANTASLNGSLTVNGGRTTLAAGAAGGGVLPRSLTGVTVATGGVVALTPSAAVADRTVLVTSALSLTGGQLDLGNGDLLLRGGSLSAVTAAAATGFAGGAWTGTGLASATAAADARHLTAIGVVQNNVGGTALFTTFDGQPTTTADVLCRYTYYGDTNLDGVVNAADYTRIDAGYILHLTGWGNGDLNYDGVVDGSDYSLMDNAFNRQSGSLASSEVVAVPSFMAATAVPEPGSVVGALAALSILGRRRRRASAGSLGSSNAHAHLRSNGLDGRRV